MLWRALCSIHACDGETRDSPQPAPHHAEHFAVDRNRSQSQAPTFGRLHAMNAINRIAHLFPLNRSTLFRDFCAHVDGFVVLQQSDDEAEASARVEVFEADAVDSAESNEPRCLLEQMDQRLAASMIPIRGGQRFRVWNHRNAPVTLCFLPTDEPERFVSVDLFAPR